MYFPRTVILMVLLLVGFSVKAEKLSEKTPCDVLQVTILPSKKVLLFGVETDLLRLLDAIKTASNNDGALLLYRVNDSKDSLITAKKVIQMAIDSELTISKSSKPDFSDLVYENGNLKPR